MDDAILQCIWFDILFILDGGNLRGFLGKHKNIYNVYKRGVSLILVNIINFVLSYEWYQLIIS